MLLAVLYPTPRSHENCRDSCDIRMAVDPFFSREDKKGYSTVLEVLVMFGTKSVIRAISSVPNELKRALRLVKKRHSLLRSLSSPFRCYHPSLLVMREMQDEKRESEVQ